MMSFFVLGDVLYHYYFPPPPCNKSFTQREGKLEGVKCLAEIRYEAIEETSGEFKKGNQTGFWCATLNEEGDLLAIDSSQESEGSLCNRYYSEIDSLNDAPNPYFFLLIPNERLTSEIRLFYSDTVFIHQDAFDFPEIWIDDRLLSKEYIMKSSDSTIFSKVTEEYEYVPCRLYSRLKEIHGDEYVSELGLHQQIRNTKKIDLIRYNSDGSVNYTNTYEFEYDNRENWIKQIIYKNGEAHLIITREYEYYD